MFVCLLFIEYMELVKSPHMNALHDIDGSFSAFPIRCNGPIFNG